MNDDDYQARQDAKEVQDEIDSESQSEPEWLREYGEWVADLFND